MSFPKAPKGAFTVFNARVVELVDAPDSKSGAERCVGSSPTMGTKQRGCVIGRKAKVFNAYRFTVLLTCPGGGTGRRT